MDAFNESYDPGSAGVLNDPSGFGTTKEVEARPGFVKEESTGEDETWDEAGEKKPSVSKTLAELHYAVSDKLQSWNPYFVKSTQDRGNSSANGTSSNDASANNKLKLLGGEDVKDGVNEEDRLGARTRVGKCTILFHGNPFWERCIRTHEQHDKVHGYRLHVLRQDLLDDVWSKPAYVLSLLLRELGKPESERLDWLLWFDADTVILNPYIPIETFLPPPGTEFDDVYLMYSHDWNGLNNGVFPIRVNQWAVKLFSAIVAYRQFNPQDPLQFRDQSAMNAMIQLPEFGRHCVQAPQRWFNAYQGEHNETLQPFQIRRGDLLVHFAGVPAREERMQYWLERAEQHFEDWEVQLKSTSYPQEARDFWSAQSALRKDNKQKLEDTRANAAKLMSTTDQRLSDYGDRMEDLQKQVIAGQRDKLRETLEDEKSREDVVKIEESIKVLSEAMMPLTGIVSEANKVLLQSAHEAIFAGEKDLLDGGFSPETIDPELQQISTTVKSLKTLVMTPEELWNRHDIAAGTNAVTEARAKYQERKVAEWAAKKQVQDAEAAKLTALEDAHNMAQKEADMAAAGGDLSTIGDVEDVAAAIGADVAVVQPLVTQSFSSTISSIGVATAVAAAIENLVPDPTGLDIPPS